MLKSAIVQALGGLGYDIRRRPRRTPPPREITPNFERIHYGSGRNYLAGWLNVDIYANGPDNYMYVDLTSRHPFPDNHFRFGFSEDFLEHIDQAGSLLFLEEAHRTLRTGGVLRLTFPCLEHVLAKHFSPPVFDRFVAGKEEAYDAYGHVHFYSQESLHLVANHIGFDLSVVEGNRSKYAELDGINTRLDVVNIHVELTKR